MVKSLLTTTTSIPPEIRDYRTIIYTPPITNTPKRVEQRIRAARTALSYLVGMAEQWPELAGGRMLPQAKDQTDLMIIDEADRLKLPALEQIRDIHDRDNIGVVLIGMPGLEKRLSRYAQLYSRVGFVHEFRSLNADESHLFLERQWEQWGLKLDPDSPAEEEAIAAIIRITNGNFRLLHRLLAQIERIVDINSLRGITKEAVEVARQQLVIGSS